MYSEKAYATGNGATNPNPYRSAPQETFPWCLETRSIMNMVFPREALLANFPPIISIFIHILPWMNSCRAHHSSNSFFVPLR